MLIVTPTGKGGVRVGRSPRSGGTPGNAAGVWHIEFRSSDGYANTPAFSDLSGTAPGSSRLQILDTAVEPAPKGQYRLAIYCRRLRVRWASADDPARAECEPDRLIGRVWSWWSSLMIGSTSLDGCSASWRMRLMAGWYASGGSRRCCRRCCCCGRSGASCCWRPRGGSGAGLETLAVAHRSTLTRRSHPGSSARVVVRELR